MNKHYFSFLFPALFFSTFINAHTNDTYKIYIGEAVSTEDESCGENGRYIKKSELFNIPHFCDDVSSEWDIWKINGEEPGEGIDFQTVVLGWGNNCEIQQANISFKSNNSWCVMKDTPLRFYAFLFEGANYQGNSAFSGKADVKYFWQQIKESNIKSLKLGENVKILGYSEPYFQGDSHYFTKDTPRTNFTIRSYKIELTSHNTPIEIPAGF